MWRHSGESGNFGESSDTGDSGDAGGSEKSDDSGESGDSSESCRLGESGDLINKVFLGILVNKLILINIVGVVIFLKGVY